MNHAYNETLVVRVNELFYDLAGDIYQEIHTEMLGAEHERWRRTFATYLPTMSRPRVIADIGSGSGLVGMTLGDFLEAADTFICADLSMGMLDSARRAMSSAGFGCRLDFRKIGGELPLRLPFENASVDILTMNSVLHHIANTNEMIDEIVRVLKPGGIFILGHEPNNRFTHDSLLRWNYRLMRTLFMPRYTAVKLTHRLGIYRRMSRLYYIIRPDRGATADKISDGINSQLCSEGLIDRKLSLQEVAAITDIRDAEGFEPQDLARSMDLVELETYNYMLLVSIKHGSNPLVQRIEAFLRRLRPQSGGTFFAVFRKPGI